MSAFWIKYLPGFVRQRFDGRPNLQLAVANTGWLMFDRIARLAISLVIAIWMARALGPAEFGQYNFALAFVALFTSLATLGLDKPVVRELVSDAGMRDRILGSAFVLKFAGAVCAMLLSIALVQLVVRDNPETRLLVTVISAGFLFRSFDVIDLWYQSRVESRFVVMARFPALLAFALYRVFLIMGAYSLAFYAWAYVLELLCAAALLYLVYHFHGNRVREWRPNTAIMAALLRECWPLIFAGLSVMLYMKVDVVMLGRMGGDNAAGIYSAATRLSEGFYFIPIIIASSVMPMLVRARAAGADPYMDGLGRLYRLMVRISLGVAIPVALLSPFLVELLFGADYAASSDVLRIHVWASVAVFLGVASSQFLALEKLQKLSLYRTLVGLVINVALNYLLIPVYGPAGAAIATLVSYFVATFSIMLHGYGMGQGVLMLQALHPLAVIGLRRGVTA